MIATTFGKSQFAANYLTTCQTVTAKSYLDNGRKGEQGNFQYICDQVHLKYSSEAVATYSTSLSLEKKISDGYDLLRGLFLNIFKNQSIVYTIATDKAEIDFRPLSPEKAQEFIADDGYFGVEKTSERIVKFAIGMAGGDPARMDAIRQGIDNGFQQALEAFGRWLPEISYFTYDTVMHKLDDWATIDTTSKSPESQTQVKS